MLRPKVVHSFSLLAAPDPALPGAVSVEQLKDLTGLASAVVTLKSRDHFANEFRYDVSVRNQSHEALSPIP